MRALRAADLFCGAGGTSTALLSALAARSRTVDLLAVNHWNVAIQTHLMNHPSVRHLCETLDGVDPRKVIAGGKLDIMAASPECTHHSNARGGKPISDQSRASAWHVLRWAEAVSPERILVENVKEFANWGPLTKKGRPNKKLKGKTFAAFLSALESLGYHVEHRVINAADHGAATTRTRLYIQAWRGQRPTWPQRTHGTDAAHPWRAASEVIDWSLRGQSVFQRERPLSANTMKRIAAGLRKFSGGAFVLTIDHTGGNGASVNDVRSPLSTITTEARHTICEPFFVHPRGTAPSQINGGASAKRCSKPMPTLTAAGGHIALVEPFLIKFHGAPPERNQGSAFAARCHSVNEPIKTLDTSNRIGLVESFLIGQQSSAAPRAVSQPVPTIATAGAVALIEPFLTKFHGTGAAAPVNEPLDMITTKDRFGLAQPVMEIEGERFVLDILFRMLQPHELKAAMGFPSEYRFAGNKGDQVKQIGNAVEVNVAKAIFENMIGGLR